MLNGVPEGATLILGRYRSRSVTSGALLVTLVLRGEVSTLSILPGGAGRGGGRAGG